MFEVEQIPDTDKLFYRVHRSYFVEGELVPGVFRQIGNGMSTDWSKYSTPQESLRRSRILKDNGIVSGNVGHVRIIPLLLSHTPSHGNRAHSEIVGVTTVKVKLKLLTVFSTWEIPLSND